jgi:hypothetical protein
VQGFLKNLMNLLLMMNNIICNKYIMSFFKKLGGSISHIAKKAGGGIRSTFVKAGKDITQGISSLAGGVAGGAIAEGLALAVAPELAVPAMLVGGIIGKEAGKQGGGLAYEALERKRPQNGIQTQAVFQGQGGKTGMRPGQPAIPIKVPKLPGPAPRPILGRDGAGQRQTNPIEKARPPEKKQDLFMP